MAHDNKLIVHYLVRTGQSISEEMDEFNWNSHRYMHEVDNHSNLIVFKHCNAPVDATKKTHVKTYARGVWTVVDLDYDEHDI